MSETSHNRNCPVCDSGSKEIITPIDFELFEGHPMNGGYDLVQCTNCGFVYADTPVTQAQLDKYYTELSKYEDKTISTGGGFTPQDKDRLVKTAIFIGKQVTDRTLRVLDLGCANGGLLRELKNVGFSNVVGIDPSPACVEITKAEVGCACYQYSLFDIPEEAGKFDVVILSHVLEHVLNVGDTVTILENLLNAGGYVYLECPNASHYKDIIHAPLQEFNTEHINHFTEVAFRNLMGRNGFETIITGDKVLTIASEQDYHAVYGFFRKMENESDENKLLFDNSIRESINIYIDESNKIFTEIKKAIAALPKDLPVALLGVGQFAFKLLKTDVFQHGKKFMLFDNNRMNAGKKIKGVTIFSGSDILAVYKREKFSIIISSLIYETAIRKGLEDQFKNAGELLPEIIGFSHLL